MHICRIRYTVLGLLIYYLQNAFSSSCVSDFDDVASKTVMADIVFEGQFYREIPVKERPGYSNIRFNKITLIKGDISDDGTINAPKNSRSEPKKDGNKKPGNHEKLTSNPVGQKPPQPNRNRPAGTRELSIPIVVGQFVSNGDPPDCAFDKKSMVRGQRYLVFLSNPLGQDKSRTSSENSKSSGDRRKTTTNPQVYRMSSAPVAASGSTRREAINHSCHNCGKIPKIAKLTKSSNVTVNRRIKLNCRATGFPKPEIYWLKNGMLLEPEGDISIKDKKQSSMLVIKNAKDEDTGQYQCYAYNALGESDLSSAFVNVVSKSSKPFSQLCPQQGFCVNGGTCYKLIEREHFFCQCTENFIGERCEEVNTGYIVLIGRKRKRYLPGRYRPRRRFYP